MRQHIDQPVEQGEPMAEQTTSSIVIDAPAAEVMAVIADFPAYPEWAQGMKKAEVVEEEPPVPLFTVSNPPGTVTATRSPGSNMAMKARMKAAEEPVVMTTRLESTAKP